MRFTQYGQLQMSHRSDRGRLNYIYLMGMYFIVSIIHQLTGRDIDLVVTKPFTESNKVRTLSDMARAMRQSKIADTVAIISKARVPIIKFVTNEGELICQFLTGGNQLIVGKLNVDISLNQVNGIAAGKIVNQYLDILPGARQMILVVKAFLSQRSMNEVYSGGLGSYSVICLVISFLQVLLFLMIPRFS